MDDIFTREITCPIKDISVWESIVSLPSKVSSGMKLGKLVQFWI
jgi:hypothetical protein